MGNEEFGMRNGVISDVVVVIVALAPRREMAFRATSVKRMAFKCLK